jgi:folate-binding protein YgfZ
VTTQKLDDLAPGTARTTLWCEFRGRLLHRATVAHAPDGAVWLLRADAPGAELAAVVDRAVFREDVRIEDFSSAHPVTLVTDGAAADDIPPGDSAPQRVRESAGLSLVVGGAPSSPGALELIEFGHARHGSEIQDAFNPYDVNLGMHVHLDKGCFTGQEALLRMVTRDKVLRGLARLRGEGVAPEPQDVLMDGAPAGRLTSAAASAGGWSALAVLRVAATDAGGAFTLADSRAVPDVRAFPVNLPLGR